MAFKNYALMRKTSGKTKLVSLMQTLKATTSGFKFFCVQGKPLTSILKVIPTPLDAKVTILADGFSQVDNSILVSIGTSINIKVEKDGYVPYETTIVANEQDYTLEFSLDKISTFKFVVDTTENPDNLEDNTFIVPFTAGTYTTLANEPLTISWGDGSETIISDGIITKELCTHTYETPGRYDITIETYSGTMPLISFGENYGDIENNKLKLVSISTPLLKVVDTSGVHNKLYNLFNGCRNLSFIPSDLFKYNNQLIDLKSCFEDCVKLTHLSNSLMLYVPNLENASNMFKNCDRIKQIPTGFLKANSKLVNCYRMFYDCDALETTPNNLFSACKNVNNYEECFYGCEKLTYNPLIFGSDFSYLGNVENINFANMFYRERFIGTNIGTAPEIWNVVVAPLEHTQGCFGEYICNETLSNYWRIPFEWGGAERVEVAMDIDPTDLNTILYNYDLFELPYYKDEGWKRAQVNPTPSDADVNIVHTLNGREDDYQQNYLNFLDRGILWDGVASEFNTANYLTFSKIPSTPTKSFETVVCFTTPQSYRTGIASEVIGYNAGDYTGPMFTIEGPTVSTGMAQYLCLRAGGSGSAWRVIIYSKEKLKTNTKYWAKAVWDGSVWYLYLSTDGKNYELQSSATNVFGNIPANYVIGKSTGSWSGNNYFTGSIDLNECYMKYDGITHWNGKSFTKVGAWNEHDNLSGLTATKYARLYDLFKPGSESWEIGLKIKTGTDLTTAQRILGSTTQYKTGFVLGMGDTDKKLNLWLSSNGTAWNLASQVAGATTLTASTTYYIKMGFTKTEYYVDISTDNKNWTRDITVTSSTAIFVATAWICFGQSLASGPFLGEINLHDAYIKIGNEIWWNNRTNKIKYWDEKYVANRTLLNPMLVQNGVASGFSTTNYLTLPQIFNPGSSSWEIVLKFKITSFNTASTWINLFGNGGTTDRTAGVHIFYNTSGQLRFEACTLGASSWNIANLTGTTVMTTNKDYWVKVEFTGSVYNVYISTNGSTYTKEMSVSSTSVIGASVAQSLGTSVSHSSYYHNGLIDLNESYIKIDNGVWWDGKKYNIVGFRDSNGTVWGFASGKYIKSPSAVASAPSSFEYMTHFLTDSALSANQSVLSSNADYKGLADIEIRSKKPTLWLSTNGTSNGITSANAGSYTLTENTQYWLRFRFNGNNYTIEVSKDKVHWFVSNNISSTAKVYGTENIWLGLDQTNGGASPFLGRIYLKDVYFDINGKRWWDCQTKDRTKYVTTIDDKEFLTLPNKEILVNVAKEGYDDYVNYHTFNSDTVLTPTLTQSSEI